MPAIARTPRKAKLKIVDHYTVAADAKKRISLRGAKTKYFHVKALSNGSFVLEPQVLMPASAVSARSLKMIERSVMNLKKGIASVPVGLSQFIKH